MNFLIYTTIMLLLAPIVIGWAFILVLPAMMIGGSATLMMLNLYENSAWHEALISALKKVAEVECACVYTDESGDKHLGVFAKGDLSYWTKHLVIPAKVTSSTITQALSTGIHTACCEKTNCANWAHCPSRKQTIVVPAAEFLYQKAA